MRLTGCLSSNYSSGAISASTSTRYRLQPGHRERERERVSKMLLGRRFTTKRDTCRMYRRLQRNGHNSGGLITTPRGESNRAYFSTLSIKSTCLGSGASIVGSVLGIFVFGPVIRLDGSSSRSIKKYSFERQDSLNYTRIIIQYVSLSVIVYLDNDSCVSIVTTRLSYLNEIKRRGKIVGDRFLHRQFAVHACIPRIVNVVRAPSSAGKKGTPASELPAEVNRAISENEMVAQWRTSPTPCAPPPHAPPPPLSFFHHLHGP